MRLTEVCSNRDKDDDIVALTDEQLRDYHFDVLLQEMANQPERAVELFELMGWKLTPANT